MNTFPREGWPLSALGLPARAEPLVLVLGLARSGLAAARLLLQRGASLRLLGLERPEGVEGEQLSELVAQGASLRLGPHDPADLGGVDLIVKSPGVRPEIPFLGAARAAGVPIVGELEIAFLAADGPIYAITGTNGKSTTTAWVGHMLMEAGRKVEVAGNIGHAFAEAVLRAPDAEFVVEVSSFQLEDTLTFHPKVATLLNLTPDHLDRHGTLEAYGAAKVRIFRNQTASDVAVLGGDANLDAIAGAVSGLCGYLWVARYGVAYSEIASGYELTVIAACVIGGVSIGGGVGTVAGTLLGALFLGIVNTALPVLQISPFWQMAIAGAVILAAVVINARAEHRPDKLILPEARRLGRDSGLLRRVKA